MDLNLKLHQERFRLDVRRFFTVRMVENCSGLPREVAEPHPSWNLRDMDVALRDVA